VLLVLPMFVRATVSSCEEEVKQDNPRCSSLRGCIRNRSNLQKRIVAHNYHHFQKQVGIASDLLVLAKTRKERYNMNIWNEILPTSYNK